MGHFFRMHDTHDYYEDLLAHALNRMLGLRALNIVDWRICMAKAHALCDDWGFKDPYFLYAMPGDIKYIQPRFFIRTLRPADQTVESWLQHNKKLGGRGDTPDNRIHFHRVCLEREMLADWKLKDYPVLRISFDNSNRLTDEEIESKIRAFIHAERELEEASA
jgi:hypothetical protein